MTDGEIATPDTLSVRLGSHVARLTPDARPGWWRVDATTSVRRADAIEIRAASLAAAAIGGGARLLAVLRAATLDGTATPLADAVMLALALGETGDPPSPLPEDGWTRVRFTDAAEPAPADPSAPDITGLIDDLLARAALLTSDANTAPPAREHQSAAAQPTGPTPTPAPTRAWRSPAAEPLPDAPTGLADPRPASQPDNRPARPPTPNATLRHRRLATTSAAPGSTPRGPSHAGTPEGAPNTAADPAPTGEPTISFPTIFFPLTGTASAIQPPLAPTLSISGRPAVSKYPPPPFTQAPSFATERPDHHSAPRAGLLSSHTLQALRPAPSWPSQATPIPALAPAPAPVPTFAGTTLPDAEALLSILARALADECDHRGIDA